MSIISEQDTFDIATRMRDDLGYPTALGIALEIETALHGAVDTTDEWVLALARHIGAEAVINYAASVHLDLAGRVRAVLDNAGRPDAASIGGNTR